MNHRRRILQGLVPAMGILALQGCNEPCPPYRPNCADGAASPMQSAPAAFESAPSKRSAVQEIPEGISWTTSTESLQKFLGTDSFKIALATGKRLYLLLPDPDKSKTPRSIRMDFGDEGPNGYPGRPNEPLFSPDGRWLAYIGIFSKGRTDSYVREAVAGLGWRIPLTRDQSGSLPTTAHPHWSTNGKETWIYAVDVPLETSWNQSTKSVNGFTWRTRFLDSAIGPWEVAAIDGKSVPGAFKGGVSRDQKWVVTSYLQTVLWEASSGNASLLNGGDQQCNPSINPFASGSNTDFFMILGFGGSKPVPTVTGSVLEGQHEHLWIWSKEDKAVWGAALPNVAPHPSDEVPGLSYYEWQRPEWSTHPDFATAFAKRTGTDDGVGYDLFIVKLGQSGGELANHDRTTLLERGPVLRVATGSIISSDWSHLWVKP
ncbi:MAG TPA: hypothetical protein PKO15_03435 [Fibrobacteria bacterium]|nr:hypothetical protein [Fibrobacteria bacterium]